jgi:hypothetical protein
LKVNQMTEYLCKEITADVVGTYLSVYRATCAFRREHEPSRLAWELIKALSQRGREVVEIFPARPKATSAKNKPGQSVFLVNGEVIVLVLKVVHLHDTEREALEKLVCNTTGVVGLALNFGSRSPEFWRAQRSAASV